MTDQPRSIDDKLAWTIKDVAHVLAISVRSIYRVLDEDPDFPKPTTWSNRNVWQPEEIREYAKKIIFGERRGA